MSAIEVVDKHDTKLWVPDSARASVVGQSTTVLVDNQTDVPDEAVLDKLIEQTAMFGFGEGTRYMSFGSLQQGTMMARSKWRPPRDVIEEIILARDYAEKDDDVGGAIGAILAAAYRGKYSNQHEDEQIEHTYEAMSEDIGLLQIMREMHRELLISSQINTVTVFTRRDYEIRPEGVSRVLSRSIAAPMVGVLPAERIRIVGSDIFGEGTLGYQPEGALAQWLRAYWGTTSPAKKREMRIQDPLAATLFIGKLTAPWYEEDAMSAGNNLYALNPEMVHRSTLAKGSWRYPRPLLTRNLPLLEAKRLLNVMDHALLQGGISYILLIRKGEKDRPGTPAEMANLQGLVQRAGRTGVLVGDHRLQIDVVQPNLSEMLNPQKRAMIGRKLSQALLRVPEFGSDDTGAATQTFTELAQAVIEDDRNIVIDHLHRHVWTACAKHNARVFGRSDKPLIWAPKVILQGLDQFSQYLLKLYDRGDLPRKYMVNFGGYSYSAVKAQKAREVSNNHDLIFAPPAVPYSAPGQMGQGVNPFQFGNPAGLPTPGGPTPGPQDNGAGRPGGSRTQPPGSAPDRKRPTRQIKRTPGEAVRAEWSEDEDRVIRIGEITEQVLGEYPNATLGRLTSSERTAVEAHQTQHVGNVLVIPVNRGVWMQDYQAVRLAENFSLLVGHRVPDDAVMAAAVCFREPAFSQHEAEDMVVRWGWDIELGGFNDMQDPDDILTCPQCGAQNSTTASECTSCGFSGAPFAGAAPNQMPLAIHLTVNGTEVTAAPGASGIPGEMYEWIRCTQCGLEQNAENQMCARCGFPLANARSQQIAEYASQGKKVPKHSHLPPPIAQQPDIRPKPLPTPTPEPAPAPAP